MKFRLKKWECYFLPLILVLVFINYHYFRFYEEEFNKSLSEAHLKPSLTKDNYQEIQKLNSYYEVYRLAQITKENNIKVFYFYSKYKSNDEAQNQYYHPLYVRINYYFYPRIIKPIHSVKELNKTDIGLNEFIISDTELISLPISKRMHKISRPGDNYYIYKII